MYSKVKVLIGIVLVAVMAVASVAAVSAMGDEAPNKMKATAKNASGGGLFSSLDVSGSMYLGSGVAKLTVTVSVGKDTQDLQPGGFISITCASGDEFANAFKSLDRDAEFSAKGKYTEKVSFKLSDYSSFDDDFNEVPATSAENCTANIVGSAQAPSGSTAEFVTVKKLSVTAKAK